MTHQKNSDCHNCSCSGCYGSIHEDHMTLWHVRREPQEMELETARDGRCASANEKCVSATEKERKKRQVYVPLVRLWFRWFGWGSFRWSPPCRPTAALVPAPLLLSWWTLHIATGGREGGRRQEKGEKKRRELSCRERGIWEVLTNFSIESLSTVLVPLRSDHSHILGHMTVTWSTRDVTIVTWSTSSCDLSPGRGGRSGRIPWRDKPVCWWRTQSHLSLSLCSCKREGESK